ncbi:MAG TPA: hypothetical protein ENO20_14555 [Bacteroides sp.]|nr:hypothetical protein [Bacteroides sp.]
MLRIFHIQLVTWVFSAILIAQDDFRVFPYLQHPAPDAMSVLWFSEHPVPGSCTYWKEGSHLRITLPSDPIPAEAIRYSDWEDTIYFEGDAPSIPYLHSIRIENLDPGTIYEYIITQGTTVFRSDFRTAPEGDVPIRFIAYADAETEPESTGNFASWADPLKDSVRYYLVDQTTGYRNNLAVIRSREPDLVFIAGDLVESGGEQRDWDEFWRHNTNPSGLLSLAGRVPLMAAPGNHEYYEGHMDGYAQPGSERAVKRFLTYFEFPPNHSPNPEQQDRYYSLRYGPVTCIVLDLCNNSPNGSDWDTNFRLLGENDTLGGNAPDFGPGSIQYGWLEERLAASQANSYFTFVFFHHAPYSSGPHGYPPGEDIHQDYQSGVPVRMLTPLFMKYGVDAVISGHDEMWERSEVPGLEMDPDGEGKEHTIHFYDVGMGGDGLRGPYEGTDNPFQRFLVHRDVPEIWQDGILVDGGKHYGHLEVNIFQVDGDTWQAVLEPVYVFPKFSEQDSTYAAYERRVYDDRIILTGSSGGTVHQKDLTPNMLLSACYPNPFSEKTFIEYVLRLQTDVRIGIHDLQGRLVRVIEEGFREEGVHHSAWDGRDGTGRQ